jgi:hypothetical protein
MPDANEAFSTLDDFLLSLADGITQAQELLARSGTAGPAGRQVTYQLPRVDFEVKMNLRVVEDEGLSARYRAVRPTRLSAKHLLFKPLTAEESSSTLEIAAVIKGAFVAVPANNGLPATLLETAIESTADPLVKRVRATVRTAAGEPRPGIEVQFNVDREESAALTTAGGGTFTLTVGTGFVAGVVTTGADGVAEAELRIAAGQPRAVLVLVIDAADRTEQLVLEVTG